MIMLFCTTFGSVSANNDLTKEDKLKALAMDGYTLDEVRSIIDFTNTDGEVLKQLMENSFYEGSNKNVTVRNFLFFPGYVQMQLFQRKDVADILIAYIGYGGKFCRAAEFYLVGKPYRRDDIFYTDEKDILMSLSLDGEFKLPYAKKVIKAYQEFYKGEEYNHLETLMNYDIPERIIRHTLR